MYSYFSASQQVYICSAGIAVLIGRVQASAPLLAEIKGSRANESEKVKSYYQVIVEKEEGCAIRLCRGRNTGGTRLR